MTGTGTIRILNWTGTGGADNSAGGGNDRLLFVNNPNLNGTQLAQFQFSNDAGTNYAAGAWVVQYNSFFEVVPNVVPEPSTWVMFAAGTGLLGVAVLRRQRVA